MKLNFFKNSNLQMIISTMNTSKIKQETSSPALLQKRREPLLKKYFSRTVTLLFWRRAGDEAKIQMV